MARKKKNRYTGPTKENNSAGDSGAEDQVPNTELAHYEKSSATLLAEQPAEAPAKAPIYGEDWNILRGHLEARVVQLRNWRNTWWMQNWSDLALYIDPKRSIWLTQSTGGIPSPNNMTRGRPVNNNIVDPTATFAARICAGGLMSGLASPSRPWFKIIPSIKGVEIDSAGREWLDSIEDIIYTVCAGSNFYDSFAVECEDLVTFGTAPSIMYEDEQDVIRCYNPAVGEYYLSSSATLRVDGLYRIMVMTIAQIVDFFGLDNCPPDIQQLWNQKGSAIDTERLVGHSIEPNFPIGPGKVGQVKGKFTWRETYWMYGAGSSQPLSLRGFHDQPFTAGRWSTQSNDAYGRSPGMDVLPDVVQLQVETLRKAEAIEKQVRPPLIADMQLKNQPSSILPGHVTYVQNLGAGSGMRPIYEVNPDIRGMMEDLREIQQRIKVGLFNDLFLMLENAPKAQMTAYEVAQKMQEKMQVLGPVIESVLSGSLKPKLKRLFGILQRRGFIPEPPESLKDVPIDVEFVSMLALAQKAAATGGLERIAALIGNLSAIYPEARHKLDVNTYIDEMNELLGNPQKVINGNEKAGEMQAAEREQAQAQQQAAAMNQGAQTVERGAKAADILSKTQIGGAGDALSMLLQ